jgi:hypothetical protein
MIETVYNNDSGDNNRTNRVRASFKMPKNIRQVGKNSDFKKIYVEDYVMTFIRQLAGEDYSRCSAAILVGQYVKTENCRNIFISGAIEVENLDTENEIIFTNDIWTDIYELIKKYFTASEIVGWFLGGPGYLMEDQEKIRKAHVNNFAGQDKTLLTFDTVEKEEAFHIFENNRLNKQEGYYIYYEKNEEMQNYMVDYKRIQSEEMNYDDRITKEIRATIQNKKPIDEENKGIGRLMYAAGTLLAIIVLMVGAAMLNNYEQMKSMQDTLNSLTRNLSETQTIFSKDTLTDIPVVTHVQSEDASGDSETQITAKVLQDESLNVSILPGNMEILNKIAQKKKQEEKTEAASLQKELNEPSKWEKKTSQKSSAVKKQVKDKSKKAAKSNTKKDVKKKTRNYTVKKGDTLIGISTRLYKSTDYVSKIMKLNNIEDKNYIYEGQRLIVP